MGASTRSARASSRIADGESRSPLPDKPSIAVLPFQNMSGDPEQEYFADGMVEDIITALSRFKSLFVIARNSSFTLQGPIAVDVKQVGRELGVRYVLEGSVRKGRKQTTHYGQLIDAQTGRMYGRIALRAHRRTFSIFRIEVTQKVVVAIAPRVERAEIARAFGGLQTSRCLRLLLAEVCRAYLDPQHEEALDLFNRQLLSIPTLHRLTRWQCFAMLIALVGAYAEDIARERDEITRLWRIVAR